MTEYFLAVMSGKDACVTIVEMLLDKSLYKYLFKFFFLVVVYYFYFFLKYCNYTHIFDLFLLILVFVFRKSANEQVSKTLKQKI